MAVMSDLAQSFPAAPPKLNAFDQCIKNNFGQDTLQKVCEIFEKLGLPRPEKSTEYLHATVGALLFLDDYGVVLRIERADAGGNIRVNDNGWILQPLGTIKVGEAIIEICPGCHVGQVEEDSPFLVERLKLQGVWYWDDQLCNGGRLPIKMPSFPEGVPVVIDRLAVDRLQGNIAKVADALAQKQAAEAVAAQEQLYGPLRQIFTERWDSGKDMKAFWDACAEHKQQGKLISGWAEAPDDEYIKTAWAKQCGAAYAQRFESVKTALPAKALKLAGGMQ